MSDEAMTISRREHSRCSRWRARKPTLQSQFPRHEHLCSLIKLGRASPSTAPKNGLDLETVRMEVEKQVGTGPTRK